MKLVSSRLNADERWEWWCNAVAKFIICIAFVEFLFVGYLFFRPMMNWNCHHAQAEIKK